VMAVQPDRALRRVGRRSGGIRLAVALRRGEALGCRIPRRPRLQLTARRAAVGLGTGTGAVVPRALIVCPGAGPILARSPRAWSRWARPIMTWPVLARSPRSWPIVTWPIVARFRVVAMRGVAGLGASAAAVAGTLVRAMAAAVPATARSGWPRRMSAGSAERSAIRGRTRGAAGTVAVGRFHCQPPIAPAREPAQTARPNRPGNRLRTPARRLFPPRGSHPSILSKGMIRAT
jgi:hypothetical protein